MTTTAIPRNAIPGNAIPGNAIPGNAIPGTSPRRRIRGFLSPWPVRRRTVVVLAALMAYADGFWLTSVQGAVGAIERAQSPFALWLLSSTLMLPLYVLAVLVALGLGRRRMGGLTSAKQIVVAGLLIVAAGTLLATSGALVSAVLDYRLQAVQVTFAHALHPHGSIGAQLLLTRQADDAGARYAAMATLISNAVLVAWVLAARGGQLVSSARARGQRRDMPVAGSPAG
jgi:hypothetical protein